jgi:hypothetical protein
MIDFQIYIDDDRYTVPTLYIASLASQARAREVAERLLNESDHHLGVEVCEDGKPLFSVGSGTRQPRPANWEGDRA